MASIFKRKYTKFVNGKKVKKQSLKYYTRLTDADGIKRTIPLFRDKTASQQRAAQLQKAIEMARAEGMKVGLFRPITLWPFPSDPLSKLADRVDNMLVVELSLGQMWEDVRMATGCKTKVHLHGRTAGGVPEQPDIIEHLQKALDSKGDEIVRNF